MANPTRVWKDVKVEYDFRGERIKEELYLTIDFDSNQIVVLPTANILLASQPGDTCNLEKLREDAIAKFKSLGVKVN